MHFEHSAAALVPSVKQATLLPAYYRGFSTLLYLLSAITILTALIVFVFLREENDTVEEMKQEVMPSDKVES